jgi:hypothetical protein
MQNFTTPKDAQVVYVLGTVQIDTSKSTELQIGESLASETVLLLAQGSEVTLAYADGTEQKITNEYDVLYGSDDQALESVSETALAQTSSETTPDNVQADIDAIQAAVESGDDIELPDTAAGGLAANEGTGFITLDRNGNELLAGAGYDTTELDSNTGTADVPVIADPIDNVNELNDNNLPDAVDDTFGMGENTQLSGTLLGNDDLGDEATTVTAFDSTSVNGGAVTVDAQGNFTYTPVTDFVGSDTFTYTITDADGDSSTATVTINIANGNNLPDAVDDTFGMAENTQLSGTLLGNDDLGDEATSVTDFDSTSVNGGAVTVDAQGNFTYIPVTDFVGSDTFTYTITDADGDASTATVTINIANVNNLPDAVDDTFGMAENTQLSGTLLGNDDLGDEATTVTDFDSTSVNGGAVTVDAQGNFTYTPVTDFVGSDTFTYTITDVDGDTSTATVTINIANGNNLPDAVDDTFGMAENTQLSGTLLGNDDLGDEATTVTDFDSTSVNGGVVTVDAVGNFSYTPVTDFVGSDTFTYTITDVDGDTSTATVTVNVANVNNLPDAVDDIFGMDENTQLSGTLLGNDDLGDETTTVTAFDSTSSNGGTVAVDTAGNFTFTPVADFVGSDTFTYTITDSDGDTSTATVTVVVNNVPVVDALPNAVDDAFAINENTTLNNNVLGNDDLGDPLTTVTPFNTATANGGTVSMEANGNFSYSPAIDFVGEETFTYTITDADGDTSSATVTVTVSAPPENVPPVAADDSFSVAEGEAVSGNVITHNDGDGVVDTDGGDGATLTVTQVNGVDLVFDGVTGEATVAIKDGTLLIKEDGSFTYTHNGNDPVGAAPSFAYTLSDGADVDIGNVTIAVTPVNNPPVAEADSFSVDEGKSVGGNVITHNDGDGKVDTDGGDGGTLNVTHINNIELTIDPASGVATFSIIDGVVTAVSPTDVLVFDGAKDNGILQINADGDFTYENKGFLEGSPAPSFEYTLSDGLDTDKATVSIAIDTNTPIANDDASAFEFIEGDPRVIKGNVTGLGRGSSGDARDNFGLDSSGTPAVTQVEYIGKNGLVVRTLDVNNTSANPITIETVFGTLSIDNMGNYKFAEKVGLKLADITGDSGLGDHIPKNSDGNFILKFSYTIQDGDTLNSETSSADLVIEIRPPATTSPKSMHSSFDETSGLIDTDFDASPLINTDEPAFTYSPELEGLSDILTDDNTNGLETYLAALGEDGSAIFDIDLAGAFKNSLVEAAVLDKGQSDLGSFATVTNGLLEGGGTIISDQAAATNAPIAEFDSVELL